MSRASVDITLSIHLGGDDTTVDMGEVVTAVEEVLDGATVYVGSRRSAFTVERVDDPIHMNIVKEGA